jgi:pimeloyl-ACP methyl ester carboxylesterase
VTTTPTTTTVVAVHGNGGGSFRFSRLPEPLAPDVALRAVDLPGFGGTPIGADVATVADYGRHLRARLVEVDRPRVLLGHGIGGSLAITALQDHDDAADGLVLHAPVGADLEGRWFPRLMRPRPARTAVKRAIAAAPTQWALRSRLFAPGVPPEVADRFLADYRHCAAFELMFDLLTPEWFASLRPVTTPAVVLWGERDRVLRHGQADAFDPLVPGARRVVEPGWGHFPMIDEPDAYATRIAELARDLVGGPVAADGG